MNDETRDPEASAFQFQLINQANQTPIDQTITRTLIWGYEKNILRSGIYEEDAYRLAITQISKTIEELSELLQALNIRDPKATVDGYGDTMVTLLMGMAWATW